MYLYKKFKRWVLYRYGVAITGNKTTRTHGFFTIINRKNVKFGNNCAFNKGVIIQGYASIVIEDEVVLSPRCMLLDAGIDLNQITKSGCRPHIKSFVHIKKGVWVGAGAILLPGVTLGEYCVVGAGSIVTKDVEPYTVVAGNPARVIKKLPLSDNHSL